MTNAAALHSELHRAHQKRAQGIHRRGELDEVALAELVETVGAARAHAGPIRPHTGPTRRPSGPLHLPSAPGQKLARVGAVETDLALEADPAVRFLDWPESVALGAAVAVTTRHGGVSEGAHGTLNLALHVGDDPERVIVNRERAAHAFGVELDDLVFAEQVHGVGSAIVGALERGRGTRGMDDAISSTDILVTTDQGTTLAILVADCVPIALLDPEARVLAVVHAAGAAPRRRPAPARSGRWASWAPGRSTSSPSSAPAPTRLTIK